VLTLMSITHGFPCRDKIDCAESRDEICVRRDGPQLVINRERDADSLAGDDTVPNDAYNQAIAEEAKEAKISAPEYMPSLEKLANETVVSNIWAAPR